MKTNQIITREFALARKIYGKVQQRTKNGFFNANLLINAYNEFSGEKKLLRHYMANNSTKEFIKTISNSENIAESKTTMTTRGKNGGTWMHPYLFLDFAMWLSPEFKLQAIKWIYDNVIKLRHKSGDNYVRMSAAIKSHYISRFNKEPSKEIYAKEGRLIKETVGLPAGKDWNSASEYHLGLRNVLEKVATKAHEKQLLRDERIKLLRSAKSLYEIEHSDEIGNSGSIENSF